MSPSTRLRFRDSVSRETFRDCSVTRSSRVLAEDPLHHLGLRDIDSDLYVCPSALLSARILNHVELAVYLVGVLTEHGIDVPPQTFSNLVGWLRRAVMTFGSISALIFILFPGKGDSPAAATTPKP